MRAIFVGAALSVAFVSNSYAQSAIETALFVLTGQEINAPGKSWKGRLKSLSTEEEYSVRQISDCVYEFSGPDSTDIVDFARIKQIDLRPEDVIGLSIAHGSKITNSPDAICYKGHNQNFCTRAGETNSLSAIRPVHFLGDVSKDAALRSTAVALGRRKQAAYAYFQQTYCKPRAY